MKILLTNDDGIDSPFITILAEHLAQIGKVTIVAPATEQSWIGKAMSRNNDVSLKKIDSLEWPAYALGGTPGDCVNIALNHILDEQPDWVVSGINIGHNAGLACVASSGTVAAAVEACLHEIPAIAASIYLPPEIFEMLRVNKDARLSDEAVQILSQASQRLADFIANSQSCKSYGIVHNFNFPYKNLNSVDVKETVVAQTMTQSLFEKNEAGEFTFTFHEMTEVETSKYNDRQCIKDGNISYTKLDYRNIGSQPK